MLNYLDIYPLYLPARYTDRVACYHHVYITSNAPLGISIFRYTRKADLQLGQLFCAVYTIFVNFSKMARLFSTKEVVQMYHKQTIQRQTERRYILKAHLCRYLVYKKTINLPNYVFFCFLLCFVAFSLNALVPLQEAGLLDSLKTVFKQSCCILLFYYLASLHYVYFSVPLLEQRKSESNCKKLD